jgi:hypothetical protein
VAVARGVDDVAVIAGDDAAACDGAEAVVVAAGGAAAREDDASWTCWSKLDWRCGGGSSSEG